jgi:dolichol-phosphate mannosyltransferase
MREVGANTVVSIVAPVYNERDIIGQFTEEIVETIRGYEKFPGFFEIVLVNDGSTDGSAEQIDQMALKYQDLITVVHLTRNFGHDSAVSAGLSVASGDAVILMDSDMQDNPVAIPLFIEKWLENYDVVYAVRTKRKENFLLRFMFASFYTILGKMANFRLPKNAGNFSLMDRSVVDHLQNLGERNRYLPGLRAWIGYRQTGIPVERRARYDKSARVGFRAKWTLAMNAFFSFSYVPIFVFRALGLASIFLAFVIFIIALITGMVDGTALEGIASPIIWIAFFAGINLFGIGVVGEYVARIYDEVKARPQYIIESITKRK